MQDIRTPWTESPERLFEILETSKEGLAAYEADKRYAHFGPNSLMSEERSKIAMLLGQFASPIVLILIVAGAISFGMGHTKDGIIIIAILIINSLLGFYQELKAETSIRSLQRLTENHVRVLRNGIETTLPAHTLVPGDVIFLGEGDLVPADVRLIESYALEVDEALLTGESLPCEKSADALVLSDAPLYERENTLFSGSSILRGKTVALVYATGSFTEIAKIAEAAQQRSPESPLTRSMRHFSKQLLVAILAILTFLGIISIFQGRSYEEMISFLIAQLVSAVPEGLPIVITLILAIGAFRLSKHKVLVRHLPSVESLGSTTLIATDKTGTITEGILSVKETLPIDKEELYRCAALCNDAHDGKGDSIDIALEKWLNEDFATIQHTYKRIFDHPFDATTRMMATVNQIDDTQKLYIKGAYETLLSLATNSEEERKQLQEGHDTMASLGLRVLAFGVSEHHWEVPENAPVRIVGLIAFADRPKADAAQAIALAREAGIRIIMITGDNPITASVIAEEIGLERKGKKVLTGSEIDTLSDEELQAQLEHTSLIARAMPENKYRIVQLLQKQGNIVAVTGDGVNDVPALKAADLGIAMGNGSEAAKASSKMVLVDNNLGVIIDAIRQGRVIADNLRKVLFYLLSTSLGEIILISMAILMAFPLPLHPTQILWINVVTDGVCDKTFAMCDEEGNVMKRKVRSMDKQFFDRPMMLRLGWFAVVTASVTMALFVYLLDHNYSYTEAITMTFTTVVAAQWVNAILIQKESEPFLKNIRRSFSINPWLWVGISIGVVLQSIALFVLPEWFHVITPTAEMMGFVAMALLAIFALEEGYKWVEYSRKK
ncbi:cation-transporting P-type ATPase [Sulfuricurvum sp.]|uniref:cation-translocating P-type ATPase n=1 Tax=Sulfuricurvum sp. TaxID=2025608 RepID=UPI00260527E5|nr:cation-transporting P-type ATPase [Sulfuricurvum sp.]MDD2780749.1 cation-transporting P-type ATPase [Sulfuricurvum sp.]